MSSRGYMNGTKLSYGRWSFRMSNKYIYLHGSYENIFLLYLHLEKKMWKERLLIKSKSIKQLKIQSMKPLFFRPLPSPTIV